MTAGPSGRVNIGCNQLVFLAFARNALVDYQLGRTLRYEIEEYKARR
jgi:hypothetical protein